MTEHNQVNHSQNSTTLQGDSYDTEASDNPAVEMLRNKIDHLYQDEPDTKKEIITSEQAGKHKSKHQAYMHQLSVSGMSLAEIQTAWHNYYQELPDKEKHEVWKEFYSEHGKQAHQPTQTSQQTSQSSNPKAHKSTPRHHKEKRHNADNRTAADVKNQLLNRVSNPTKGRLSKKAHFHSILFGLGIGFIAIAFLLFGFFNERFIAPFITPSKNVSNAPIIIDSSTAAVGPESKIIIPKINVEIPVVYDEPSVDEKAIQHALERGVVHYATTPLPGEVGNGVIFGHSSNNILNKGQYKFAFVLLKRLEVGDTFMLQKDGKRFVYKVTDKKIVKPSDVSVLTTSTNQSTMTLITCDPPGTSLNRLLVTGQQISPDPATNIASTAQQNDQSPSKIPGNAPSLWDRFKSIFSS